MATFLGSVVAQHLQQRAHASFFFLGQRHRDLHVQGRTIRVTPSFSWVQFRTVEHPYRALGFRLSGFQLSRKACLPISLSVLSSREVTLIFQLSTY